MSERTKHFFITNDEIKKNKIIDYLNNRFSLPQIYKVMDYYSQVDGNELHIRIQNDQLYFSIKPTDQLGGGQRIYVPRAEISTLFNIIKVLRYTEGFIGIVDRFQWSHKAVAISLVSNSLLGDLFEVEASQSELKKLLPLLNELELKLLNYSDIKTMNDVIERKNDKLFDKYGFTNGKVLNFLNSIGIPYTNDSKLKEVLYTRRNSYELLESPFEQLTGEDLIGQDTNLNMEDKFSINKTVSIIIPYFKSSRSLKKVLLAIKSQTYNSKLIEVIVIVDGLENNDFKQEDYKNFGNVKFIISTEHIGRSATRNLGGNIALGEYLVFIDSDIILPKNYLKVHLKRLIAIPNLVTMSLKSNIEINDNRISDSRLKMGVEPPEVIDDTRKMRILENNNEVRRVEMVNESNYFKEIGHNRKIGDFDSAGVLISHNYCISKKLFQSIGGFNTEFKGWGLEDTFLGAKILAYGGFILPIISVPVYHINHEARSGSEENKLREFNKNKEVYNNLLEKDIYEIFGESN